MLYLYWFVFDYKDVTIPASVPKIVIICVSVLCLLLILTMVVLTITCRQPPLARASPSPHQLRKAEEYLEISPSLQLSHHRAPVNILTKNLNLILKYFYQF